MKIKYIAHIFALFVFVATLSVTNVATERRTEKRCMEEMKPNVTDTVIISGEVRIDTVAYTNVVYVDRVILDTVWLYRPTDTFLVVEQRYYTNDTDYELWVSGIDPKLDSIYMCHMDSIVYVDRVTTIYPKQKRVGVYACGGVSYMDRAFVPKVGVYAVTSNGNMLGANVGMFGTLPIFGVTYGRIIF